MRLTMWLIFYVTSSCILMVLPEHLIITPNSNSQYISYSNNKSTHITISELSEFINISQLKIEFYPGKHVLDKSGFIVFKNITEVDIYGTVGSEIVCTDNAGFLFSLVDKVSIVNLSFYSCGSQILNLHLFSAVYMHLVANFSLKGVLVENSRNIGIVINKTHGTGRIDDSTISSSHVANVLGIWDLDYCTSSPYSLMIKDTAILHGGSNTMHGDLGGGINIKSQQSGSFIFDNVTFFNNSGYSGGNINLVISQCSCYSLNISITDSLISGGRAVLGAGLSFSEKQDYCRNYSLSPTCSYAHYLTISSTVITNNHALEKGGGLNILIGRTISIISISLYNSSIVSNTVNSTSGVLSSFTNRGGGMNFEFVNKIQPTQVPVLFVTQSRIENNSAQYSAGTHVAIEEEVSTNFVNNKTAEVVVIQESFIRNNHAHLCGGGISFLNIYRIILSSKFRSSITIKSSMFEGNTARIQASALYISSVPVGSFQSIFLQIHNSSFVKNRVELLDVTNEPPSTLYLSSTTNFTLSNCNFYYNNGSGIGAIVSRILVVGMLRFLENYALVGGGMALLSSYVSVNKSGTIMFRNNFAHQVGGAIYSNHRQNSSCFLVLHGNLRNDTILFFVNNSAFLAGDTLYEHAPSNCSHFKDYKSYQIKSNFNPYQVCICNQDNIFDCDKASVSVSVVTGLSITLNAILTDSNGSPTPGYASFRYDNGTQYAPEWWIEAKCSRLTFPSTTLSHLSIVPKNYRHQTGSYYKRLNVMVSVEPCPFGFQMSRKGTECECTPQVYASNQLECNMVNLTILRISKVWIGQLSSNVTAVYRFCPYGFCTQDRVEFDSSNTDGMLCSPGRSGILCGECKHGLSLTIGSENYCMPCSNSHLALVLIFGALGIVVVVLVTGLKLTITEGTINGLLFYAAVFHLNGDSFFQHHSNNNLFRILVSWLNLDFGLNVCFYDGMTPYTKVWLQFLFPVYLCFLEIIVIVLSHWSSKLARITGADNRLKVISTIFLLSYMKVLRNTLLILSYANIQLPVGIKTVWLYDGNIEYFNGKHIPLFVVGILFIVLVSFPYTVLIFLVQVIQRLPLCTCDSKRDVILDAHVGPFKGKFRFWLGFLVLLYNFLVSLYYFTGGNKEVNLTALIIVCSLLLLAKAIFRGVYKDIYLSYLEALYLFNILILSAIILQLSRFENEMMEKIVHVMATFTYIQIVVNIAYHFYSVLLVNKDENRVFSLPSIRSWLRNNIIPWNDYYQASEDDISTSEYEDAENLIQSNNNQLTEDDILTPIDWLPTKFPAPNFREDPCLLDTCSDKNSEFSEQIIFPDLINVKPSILIVNREEEEASLITDPQSEISRSQISSTDESGDRIYIIQDEYTRRHTYPEKLTPDVQKRDIRSTEANNQQKIKEDSPLIDYSMMNHPHSMSHDKLSSHKKRQIAKLPKHMELYKRRTRRPRPGSICYKCCRSLPLQDKLTRYKITNTREEHNIIIKSHDISIKIPPSAITGAHEARMEVGILLNGPFQFPTDVRPISPILWICISNNASLCKSIEVNLPHFVKIACQDDVKKLGITFMKANHHFSKDTGKFDFVSLQSDNSKCTIKSQQGILQTNHFCFLCIVANHSRHLYEHASYCLTRVDPIRWNFDIQQEIFFIVSYFMKTCIQVS